MERLKKVKCPVCKKMGAWFEAEYGPFCSKRCKLVDLGKWFAEEYSIAGQDEGDESSRVERTGGVEADDL